ncbi:MAG: heterocyst frequency control protein PatD [Oscillatoria sp. PMC 1068.18]|nr:heterocyst frequency control protein PatD [Oscillatoria sp. PMC 1076.18]MEC4990110.1 heterocyst frequency control protein PatD [Oscillatoria sp. PMC 1068.18]
MLPRSHTQQYEDFLKLIRNLQKILAEPQADWRSLQAAFQPAQSVYEQKIKTLTSENLAVDVASRWQSIQTEILRAWRLLQTEIVFLQASRSRSTSSSRLTAAQERLQKLIDYCELMLSTSL